jgi:hypothetical protein
VIELLDTLPDVNVQPAEYKRLLGLPHDYVLTGRTRELADWARAWYAKHGRPWLYARACDRLELAETAIHIDDVPFDSQPLRKMLDESKADRAVIAAVSAGPELELEAQSLWQAEKPDEYFFLEMYGSAVVEHLIALTGARLCAWADSRELAVLPHYSPGYPEWDISDQPQLLSLIRQTRSQGLPCEIDVLQSGMLRPKKSLLAVFGLTPHVELARPLTELALCENCSYLSCQYRRAPYQRSVEHSTVDVIGRAKLLLSREFVRREARREPRPPNLRDVQYSINSKALKRWADERLTLTTRDDGTIEARFRYEGTTCTNLGRELAFDYRVILGPREEGYPIRDEHCGPAPGDTGHTYMCRYMNNAEHLMVAIDREKPLVGHPLNDVLSWQRPNDLAGCYCEPASRKHKWGLVLETIHYALAQRERD